ncbi:hypothetical protein GW891_01905 [bacterium]|nr:hypothetical protein [bacterium]
MGLDQDFTGRFLCAYSIKSLHIGPAAFNQSQLIFVADQSVFHAQTTVVICGVYHIVHRFDGYISFLLYCFVEVQVFAATILSFKLIKLFQLLGRVLVSLRIEFII